MRLDILLDSGCIISLWDETKFNVITGFQLTAVLAWDCVIGPVSSC